MIDMMRFCRWTGKFCSHGSCDFIDSTGQVCVCDFHRNPLGRFMRRLVRIRDNSPVVYNKHFLRRGF